MVSDSSFTLDIERLDGFRFEIRFDDPAWSPVLADEPPPLGAGSAPNPARFLAAAVGSCLAASLTFCLQKAHVDVSGMRAHVEVGMGRNERGRLRIGQIHVQLEPRLGGDGAARMARCLEIFEDFCVVTQSVREGIDVRVDVVAREAEPAAAV